MIRRYPSVFLLVFIVAGIILADQTRLTGWLLLSLAAFGCALGCWRLRRGDQRAAMAALGLAILLFSAFHFAVRYYSHGSQHISNFIRESQRYHIYGRVSDWPDLKVDRTEIKIAVDSLADDRVHLVHGSILLRVIDTTTALQRGDRVEFFGRIYPLRESGFFTGFDYRRFLNLRGVFGLVYASTLLDVRVDKGNRFAPIPVVDDLRSAIRESLYRNLSPTNAALAAGFLIGETRNIPTQVYYRFRDSGTLHLLAVSGSNVALVLLFLIVLMRPLGLSLHKRAIALLVAVGAFALLSYGEPSVLRASVMAALVIMAGVFQRRFDLNNVIAAAAVIILLADPSQLFDVGFQLSFVIAWGLIFAVPRIAVYFRSVQGRWWYRYLIFPFVVSLVAQIFSIGIIALYFGRIPLIAPLANLIVVPLVSLAVIGVLAVLAAHLVLPVLGSLVGSWLDLLLSLIVSTVDALGGEWIPSVSISNVEVWAVLVSYVFLIGAFWSLSRRRLRRLVVFSGLIVVNLMLMGGIVKAHAASGSGELCLIAVPGGVASVVCRGEGRSADLVVTGLGSRRYPVDERILIPFLNRLGAERLDAVFVLSADFGAVDDLLRLCRSCSARHLYVAPRLENSFLDVMAGDSLGSGFQVSCFGSGLDGIEPLRDGYCPTKLGLAWKHANLLVEFTDCLEPEHLKPSSGRCERLLVTGGLWKTTDADIRCLDSLGVDRVFCAKIVQPEDQMNDDSSDFGLVGSTVEFVDLSRTGLVRVPVSGL